MAASMKVRGSKRKSSSNTVNTTKLIVESDISKIKALGKTITQSKRNLNSLLDLIAAAKTSQIEDVKVACVRALHKVFSHYIPDVLAKTYGLYHSAEIKVQKWLAAQYKEVSAVLLGYVSASTDNLKDLAVSTLMKFVELEGKNRLAGSTGLLKFSTELFERLVKVMLLCAEDQQRLVTRFAEYLNYGDIRYHYMVVLRRVIEDLPAIGNLADTDDATLIAYTNVLTSMLTVKIPKNDCTEFLIPLPKYAKNKEMTELTQAIEHRKLYDGMWVNFTKRKLTSSMYKKILVSLGDGILPNMQEPLLFADWLSTLYEYGGAVSLMALNGLFVMMTTYNLEYPNFYQRLYRILCLEVFHAKYKARFFHLLDIFLQSTLLPTYLVAAFIKRLARLALHAPPHGALLCIELIISLFIRHKSCSFLKHRETSKQTDDEDENVANDPFDENCEDLATCGALQSSLWEVKTLSKHWFHRVAVSAKKIEKPLPKIESNLDDLLNLTYENMLEQELKKTKRQQAAIDADEVTVPVHHINTKDILQWETTRLSDLWVMESLT